MTYDDILNNKEVIKYYKKGDEILETLGYTDHSTSHTRLVAEKAGKVLELFGCDEHEIELAKIAAYLHDIGNSINRTHHAEYGAMLVNEILKETDMPVEDRVTIVSAIANHDESTGVASDNISAALIIADKSDVRRSRVCEKDPVLFDVHDRVNYAVTKNDLDIDADEGVITLDIEIDENICSMYEYFDIFLGRMMMCQHAARVFKSKFSLRVNGHKVL